MFLIRLREIFAVRQIFRYLWKKKNTEQLVIDMFKTEHALAFYFFESVFVISNNSIKVHSKSDFCLPINTKYFGKNSVQKY